ncbi:DUF512 domain-containing protein [bacterium]|nr:DUF512 domain-containing protein [bacterium]RQV98253.1 MAG: DUF512 domain-containing protein [bacterium]
MKFDITGRIHSPFLMIESIEPGSLADREGLKPGSVVESINGHPIRDVIDLRFYEVEPELDVIIRLNQQKKQLHIQNHEMASLGIIPSPIEFRCCANHCQFCFIDQNPKNMRHSLYLKDEDYRLSFMHGNYVTLTNTVQPDLNRIVEQRLSPLYISVHAVDSVIRKQLLGLRKDDGLMKKLQFLADHDIEMHGQVVLCPGINDSGVLDHTIQSLVSFYPHMQSLAIVPVGLTKHRQNLPKLQPVTSQKAKKVVQQVSLYQEEFNELYGQSFVYLADEFYLLCNHPIPLDSHYGEYWQIENGVGMTRWFIQQFNLDSEKFPSSVRETKKNVIVTGMLAAPVLQSKILPVLRKIRGLNVALLAVENKFYGSSVTVSGLITGQDILNAIKNQIRGHFHVLIPENCVNHEGFFLDNMTPEMLAEELNNPVTVISGFGEQWN